MASFRFPWRLFLLALLVGLPPASANAERRCGWLENPTPANWWVSDKDGLWILGTQGQPETKGMDRMPDLSTHDYVSTNGGHGYACACVDAQFKGDKVAIEINAVRQLPLSTCKRDRTLPAPGQ